MAKNYAVGWTSTLERFLAQEVKMQPWRIPYLIQCGAVRVSRDRKPVTLAGPETRLKEKDLVQVDDPLSAACTKALEAIPAADYLDYAFVPGTTKFDKRMAGLMDKRPQTFRIDDPLVTSLSEFIRAMTNNAAVKKPIRHLVISSHANPEGNLFMKLSFLAADVITYEQLEEAVKDKSLLIDMQLLEPRPKDTTQSPIAPLFLIRGCRIGITVPFLKKLKEALGNKITVVAPKHFHMADIQSDPPGFVEFMSYNFAINRPKKFRNKAEAVKIFSGKGFTFIPDKPPAAGSSTAGTPVPAKLWPLWIPEKELNKKGDNDVPASIVNPITKAPETIPARWRYRPRQFLDQAGSVFLPKDPGTEAARKKAVRDDLVNNLARYQDTHPFPEYVRYGYKTMDEFMDGWKWKFSYDKSSKLLSYNASRHEYVAIRPITEPTTRTLILNYYPSGKKGTVLEQLAPSDTRFFETV
jgi:hypothetical protein